MLGYDLEGKKRMFFNFRHAGASHIAQRGKTPAHFAVVLMMGDTSVATVNRHYFKMEPDLMRELVLGWARPNVDVASVAAADLFGSDHGCICAVTLRHASLAKLTPAAFRSGVISPCKPADPLTLAPVAPALCARF